MIDVHLPILNQLLRFLKISTGSILLNEHVPAGHACICNDLSFQGCVIVCCHTVARVSTVCLSLCRLQCDDDISCVHPLGFNHAGKH